MHLIHRECFFTSASTHRRDKFMECINHSFGSGGMTCGLDPNIVPYFIQSLKRQMKDKLPTKIAIIRPGRQEDGSFFLNDHTVIDEDGELIDFCRDTHVWIDKELISDNDKILVSDTLPKIHVPLSVSVLKEIFLQIQACLKHNLIPGLLIIAGAAMAFHYRQIVSTYGGCSIMVATGPPATGKSTAIKVGLSLFGCSNNNVFVKGTNRGFLERSSISSLPYAIEDPSNRKGKSRANYLDIEELAVDLYNGSSTTNFNAGILQPMSIDTL